MSTQLPTIKEKLGSAVAYLTLGIWGLIWLLISRKNYFDQKDFVRFHCYQSLFIGMLYMFIPQGITILFSLIMQILSLIPGISFITGSLHVFHGLLQQAFYYGGLILIIYCVIFCLYGKYTNIPWISQLISRMLR
ncbi:MAG: hypothetical protein HYY52_02055 [Candidatus Melainabacteria bacterium]|nr:hypothetical protein [Candidatus Melainabacteria bacterium]